MAETQKQTEKSVSTSHEKFPEKNDATSVVVLALKEKELLELQAQHKLELVQAEIDRIRNGGRSPQAVKRHAEAVAKREKTDKEVVGKGEDKKTLCLYRILEKSYKATSPGGLPSVLEAGAIIKIPFEVLPGESLEAIVKTEAARPVAYAKA